MVSLKRNIQPDSKPTILPADLQEQVNKSGTLTAPPHQNFLQKIQQTVTEFFGTDKNTKIQKRYESLVSSGLDDKTATEIAIKSTNKQLKQSDIDKLSLGQKKSLSKVATGEMTDVVFGFVNPEKNIVENAGKEIIEKVAQETPVSKIIKALKEAKPLRGQQEAIYSAERGAKIAKGLEAETKLGGQAGYQAKKAALGGELTKVKFEPIKVSQTDIDSLFNDVSLSQKITEWEKMQAGEGLSKMIAGKVPTEGEIATLNRVFPQEMTQELLNKRSLLEKTYGNVKGVINIPRAIMSSMDLSFGGRQGAFLGTRYRKEFADSWLRQFKLFGSEKAYQASQEAVRANKYFSLAQENGLSFTDIASGLGSQEEQFMSNFVDKIPLVRGSARAYTGFANKFRMDVFSRLVKNAETLGLDTGSGTKLIKDIAGFVNTGTGRGSLGYLERISTGLNTAFFSPRLMASRLQLLNPVYYTKLHPFVRKEALKSLLTFATTETTILGLLGLAGANVGIDIRSSDFGKIKVGNTRIELSAGFQPYIRAAGQLLTGKYVSSTTGKEYTLGEGYKPLTRLGILGKQLETKLSPPTSFAVGLLKGQDAMGNKFNIPQEIINRFIPMVAKDIYELSKDNPDLLPVEALGIFGLGVQTYSSNKKTTNPIRNSGGTSLKRK